MMKSLYDLDLADRYVGTKKMGCAMLQTSSPLTMLDPKTVSAMKKAEYVSKDRKHSWIRGVEVEPHVTVRWGFTPHVRLRDMEHAIKHMPVYGKLFISGWEIFPSPYAGEPYDCVVALVRQNTTWLWDLHRQLGVLPNLMTFPQYRPHVTIGYFKQGFWTPDIADKYLKESVSVGPWKFSGANGTDEQR
jgi:hypothetical protein